MGGVKSSSLRALQIRTCQMYLNVCGTEEKLTAIFLFFLFVSLKTRDEHNYNFLVFLSLIKFRKGDVPLYSVYKVR